MPPPMIPIDGRTRIVGVIGDPIEHSRSPAMHNAAFRALRLPFAYVAFRVAPGHVGHAVAAVRALGLVGLNVTIPHKEAVIRHLDELSPAAEACAAVNTIVNRDGVLHGDNTDVVGLARDLQSLGVSRRRRLGAALVIGAGGAARAAVYALGAHARRVVIAARRPERAAALANEMHSRVASSLEAISLSELAPTASAARRGVLSEVNLIVHATPVGMKGEPFPPFDYATTPADCLFYDMIYTSKKTSFLAGAARLRRPFSAGLGMLLHQGAAAFELWTGRKPPIEVMRRALRRTT